MAYALYSQFHLGLEPCPLCIFQRIGVSLLGVLFLAAALQHPRGAGRYGYALLIGLVALATALVAARHLYVQSLPPGTLPSCGAPLSVLLKFTPVWQVVRKVLTGSGECSEVNWRFLGLAMPAWVLLWSLALGGIGVIANVRRRD
jgi:disulfide bond formation protein DsbB